ncbi:MAG: hypothetical protein U5K75_00255 [Ahrensia sp.]|nr:hypothetical protein [Ahrensia sp.]
MAKAHQHPHVSWRDGRPRFTPSKSLRDQGHIGKDLKTDDGQWFTRGQAVDWSEAFQAQLAKTARAKPRGIPKSS